LRAIHPEDAGPAAAAWKASVSSGTPFRFEFRAFRAADQMYRWCISSALPLFDAAGRVAKWHGTVVDWHDWKEAQASLHKAQMELERAARIVTVGELAASVAHEISQPLAAIATNGETCLHWLSKETLDLAKARAAIRRVLRDRRRAGQIIERIRALLSKHVYERVPVNVNDVIREVLMLTRSHVRERNVLVSAELNTLLPLIGGDRVQLHQVVLNLIMNSLEAMAPVAVGSRELTIKTILQNSGDVLVSVRDNGLGFAPGTAEQIFNPFFTTKGGGMGMGLSICRSIVEAHSGRLWASAAIPRGAILQFTLPAMSGDVL
jgi:C4-dicarboxylate-specific signal transduction histidine kinase